MKSKNEEVNRLFILVQTGFKAKLGFEKAVNWKTSITQTGFSNLKVLLSNSNCNPNSFGFFFLLTYFFVKNVVGLNIYFVSTIILFFCFSSCKIFVFYTYNVQTLYFLSMLSSFCYKNI